MRYTRKWGRRLLAMLLALSMVATAGCSFSFEYSDDEDSERKNRPSKNQADAEQALEDLREEMDGTEQAFAAAYLGTVDYDEDPIEKLEHYAPALCEDMPFLTQIPKKRIVGVEQGEMYCIVPADPEASVQVYGWRINENEEEVYDDLLYESDSGEPFLLICNTGWNPDTILVVDDVTWYPQLDELYWLDVTCDEDWNDLLLDFSSYAEILTADYFDMLERGWEELEEETLLGTWSYEGYEGERYTTYQVRFKEDTADVFWNDGYSNEDYEYLDVPWELKKENGFVVLIMDFGEFAGRLRYNLLIDREEGSLYTALDASTGEVETGFLTQHRFLYSDGEASTPAGSAPAVTDMIGTWELAYTLAEGYQDESRAGMCTVEIISSASSGLLMSYTDPERPDFNFQLERLVISESFLYSGCGNEEWMAEVDCAGPYNTTYAVTLVADGTLIKQNYFLLDGAPTVSYEFFRRVS